jgi:hypothetical protein
MGGRYTVPWREVAKQNPRPDIGGRVALLAGALPVAWTRVERGYTPAERWVVGFEDGRSAFAKIGVNDLTAGWLRAEQVVYSHLQGDFIPRLLGWDDDGAAPILLLEDLSAADWPPPWSGAKVGWVLEALAAMHAATPPEGLPSLEAWREDLTNWWRVAEEPAQFLSLGLCSENWLEAAIPILMAAEKDAVLEGEELLHLDVRSDNICFAGKRAVLVDWNHASIGGNARLDVVAWMPSLQSEGGPEPDSIVSGDAELIAMVAGYFAHRAGLPPLEGAPGVRGVQLSQLRSALPWVARALGLPPPDGSVSLSVSYHP